MKRMAMVLLVIGCHGASKNATAKGAHLIVWESSMSTRPAFKGATFADHTSRDDVIAVKACDEEVKIKLHLDLGTAKYTEADQAMSLPAISQLGAMLEDGKGFQITNGGCDGPNYNLGAPGTPPTQTILDCHFHATKPNSDCAVMFQLAGDGTLLAK